METEFIFWRHATSAGVRVEEICGGEDRSAAVWKAMALQVFGENGGDRFREIVHTGSGAPLLDDSQQRISVSHTQHFMVIAMLPRTPEADLEQFSQRTALGVDCEKEDRGQVLKVIDRVCNPEEMALIQAYASEHPDQARGEQEASILMWTAKEALYKAALTPGLDFRSQVLVDVLPEICGSPLDRPKRQGKGRVIFPSGENESLDLFSYRSEGHVVTLAYSPKCAKFKKS